VRVCEGIRLDVQERYVQVLDEFFMRIRDLLGNNFKYVMYTSAGKPNQQERKVYFQVKNEEYAISLS
jgi:hypothetical protein